MIKNYKSFWKQMGILTIITFVMSIVYKTRKRT